MASDLERGSLLASLEPRFRAMEAAALVSTRCPDGSYPCFRLDGVRASKAHLKNELVNEDFGKGLASSIELVYYVLRDAAPRAASNFFLCACSFSDEVSFVLNNRGNYFDSRLMKVATLLAGALSAGMTGHFKPSDSKRGKTRITFFDARPVVLDDLTAVADYLRYRWLVSRRNSMGKVLRLHKVVPELELFETDLKSDLGRLSGILGEHRLEPDVRRIMSTFRIWLPDDDRRLVAHSLDDEEDITRLLRPHDEF